MAEWREGRIRLGEGGGGGGGGGGKRSPKSTNACRIYFGILSTQLLTSSIWFEMAIAVSSAHL